MKDNPTHQYQFAATESRVYHIELENTNISTYISIQDVMSKNY